MSRRAALWTSIVSANLPDSDILLWLTHGEHTYITEHRGFTHSIFGLLLFPPLVAAVARRLCGASFRVLWLLATSAVLSHLVLDVTTSWGTMLLYPLDRTRFALPWAFIVDPVFWLILGAALWRGHQRPEQRRRYASWGLTALAGYIGLLGVFHAVAVGQARDQAAADGVSVDAISAWPTPMRPYVRSAFVTSGRFKHHYLTNILAPPDHFRATWVSNLDDPAVRYALEETAPGRDFAAWAQEPIARVGRATADGRTLAVELQDLRFRSAVLGEGPPAFSMIVELQRSHLGHEHTLLGWRWRNRGQGDPAQGLHTAPTAAEPKTSRPRRPRERRRKTAPAAAGQPATTLGDEEGTGDR